MTASIKTAADYMMAAPEQRQLWEAAFRRYEWLRTAPAVKLRDVPADAMITIGQVAAVANTSAEVRAGDVVLFNQHQAVRVPQPPAPQPPDFPIEIWSLNGRHQHCLVMVTAIVCKFERQRADVN